MTAGWLVVLVALVALVAMVAGQAAARDYTGYQVWRAEAGPRQAGELLGLEGSVTSLEVLVGRENITVVDLLVSPAQQPLLLALLRCVGISHTLTVPDLQRNIDTENVETEPQPESRASCAGKVGLNWSRYHDYATLSAYLSCLATDYPDLVTLHTLGASWEGRALVAVQVGTGGVGRRAVWLDGGMHAREWISPATVAFILREVVEHSDEYSDILQHFDLFIMPSVNPDGYEFSRNHDRSACTETLEVNLGNIM